MWRALFGPQGDQGGTPRADVQVIWRSRWLVPLVAFWAIVAFLFPSRMWLPLFAGLGLVVGVAYAWARSLSTSVSWERRLRQGIIVVGDVLVESFEGHNSGPFPVLWAEVRDYSDVPGYRADRVEALDGHSTKRWEVKGVCQRRGVFHLGPWEVVSGDPFGLYEVRWRYPESRKVVIYPRIVHVPPLRLPRGLGDSSAQQRRPASSTDVIAAGARAYQPGDPLRHIHWPLTAHRGQFMTRVFDTEPSGDVWLVLDLDAEVQAGEGERSTEEYMVTLAASLAAKLVDEGRAVGGLWAGARPVCVAPQPGRGHLWRLLALLAEARAGRGIPLAALLDRSLTLFGQSRTLVLFTPSTSLDWVPPLLRARRAGLSAAVIWFDPRTFSGEPGTGDTPPWAHVLSEAGIPWHRITADLRLQVALKVRRRRKVLRVLPGTGRVIVDEVVEEV